MDQQTVIEQTIFAKDIQVGLSSIPKFIPSKYFYDERGDRLFQAIMRMPEYYLTDSEYEILSESKEQLLKIFSEYQKPFNLIELGAGDGFKTKILLNFLNENQVKFTYMPVDISEHALDDLQDNLRLSIPGLKIKALHGDYLKMLEKIKKDLDRKIILFLGSSIGNFEEDESVHFLTKVGSTMNSKDILVIGFDLKKDPQVILNAYNDKQGITKSFNFNLLERINKELGGNFDISKFMHYPIYDPVKGEARSFLVSRQKQEVFIKALQASFKFDAWELIHVEVSKKYDLTLINSIAKRSGFKILYHFNDDRKFFLNSVWTLE
jgi:L-histidine Nalpha-methyltransferase